MRTHILDKITATKRTEVQQAKQSVSIEELEQMPFFSRHTNSLAAALRAPGSTHIIAEHKRQSPSKGQIHTAGKSVIEIVVGYAQAGVAGSSILTDQTYFGGSLDDLLAVRDTLPQLPLLRKEFIVDEYQLYEAKAYGADVILLIAACLTPESCLALAKKAKALGLEVLLEVHDQDELSAYFNDYVDMLGVNNRNLKTFEVSLDVSRLLAPQISDAVVKVSESGIHTAQDLKHLYALGYRGFLIGEQFMKTADPAATCRTFMESIRSIVN